MTLLQSPVKTTYVNPIEEWFDKNNGNSYFSVQIEDIEKDITYKLPFQYGYGSQSEYEVKEFLGLKGFNSDLPIKFIKIDNCKKRDVVQHGEGTADQLIKRQINNHGSYKSYYYCD